MACTGRCFCQLFNGRSEKVEKRIDIFILIYPCNFVLYPYKTDLYPHIPSLFPYNSHRYPTVSHLYPQNKTYYLPNPQQKKRSHPKDEIVFALYLLPFNKNGDGGSRTRVQRLLTLKHLRV